MSVPGKDTKRCAYSRTNAAGATMAFAGHLWSASDMQGQGPQLPGAGAGGQAGRAPASASANGQGAWPAPGAAPPPAGPVTPQPAGQPAAAPSARPAGQPAAAPSAQPAGQAPAAPAAPLFTEQKMFRLPGAIFAWWAWVIFAVACLADVAATGRNHTAAEIAATLVLVTGIVYACALRPRVVAGSSGITVMNPLREHRIPWGSVAAVDLKESVQVHCVKEPGAKRGKIIYSWALYAPRRNRLRAELIRHGDRRRLPRSAFDAGEPASGRSQDISKQSAAQIMATQLDELARDARDRGAAGGPRVVSWAWLPTAAILAPAVLLVLVITVFT
jgi:hypothetical protein